MCLLCQWPLCALGITNFAFPSISEFYVLLIDCNRSIFLIYIYIYIYIHTYIHEKISSSKRSDKSLRLFAFISVLLLKTLIASTRKCVICLVKQPPLQHQEEISFFGTAFPSASIQQWNSFRLWICLTLQWLCYTRWPQGLQRGESYCK
jgi:hypothetical protein